MGESEGMSEVLCCDCRAGMGRLSPGSVDAIVTDPPYGLGFMGKDWDHAVPGVQFWEAALRVAKPGAHLVAFGGTRLYHRLTCAIEDAGWEIRDSLMYIFGSGFPKSLNVGKAIDKQRHDREDIYRVTAWVRGARDAAGIGNAEIDAAFGANGMGRHWTDVLPGGKQPAIPTLDQVPKLLELLGNPEVPEDIRELLFTLNGRKGQPGEAWGRREVIGTRTTGIGTGRGSTPYIGDSENRDITAPATEAAKRWEGWGTALKPSYEPVVWATKPLSPDYEPIVLARKPFPGTVAANVLEHGTGAINVEACKIGTEQSETRRSPTTTGPGGWKTVGFKEATSRLNTPGRWPANLILNESAAAMLDEQSGDCKTGKLEPHHTLRASENRSMSGPNQHRHPRASFGGDSGGASRFFFVSRSKGGKITPCDASNATSSSSQQSPLGDSALRDARAEAGPMGGGTQSASTTETQTGSRLSEGDDTHLTQSSDSKSSHESGPPKPSRTSSPVPCAEQSEQTDTTTTTPSRSKSAGCAGPATSNTTRQNSGLGGVGSVRFHYTSKVSTAERNRGTDSNPHPTLKPVDLMRWLVRLVTPPGGLVLDPFCGSGSTGVACALEGFRFMGMELDEESASTARDRILHAGEAGEADENPLRPVKLKDGSAQGSLFDPDDA